MENLTEQIYEKLKQNKEETISQYNGMIQLSNLMFTGVIFRHIHFASVDMVQRGLIRQGVKYHMKRLDIVINDLKNIYSQTDKQIVNGLAHLFPCYAKDYINDGGSVTTMYMFDTERIINIDSLMPEAERMASGTKHPDIVARLLIIYAVSEIADSILKEMTRQASAQAGTSLYSPNIFQATKNIIGELLKCFGCRDTINATDKCNEISEIIVEECIDAGSKKAFDRAIEDYFEYSLAKMVLEVRENKKLLPTTKAHLLLLLGQKDTEQLTADLKHSRIALGMDDVFDIKDCIHRMKKTPSITRFLSTTPLAD